MARILEEVTTRIGGKLTVNMDTHSKVLILLSLKLAKGAADSVFKSTQPVEGEVYYRATRTKGIFSLATQAP